MSINLKALYIIANAGFSNDIARLEGAKGATIINARGVYGNYY